MWKIGNAQKERTHLIVAKAQNSVRFDAGVSRGYRRTPVCVVTLSFLSLFAATRLVAVQMESRCVLRTGVNRVSVAAMVWLRFLVVIAIGSPALGARLAPVQIEIRPEVFAQHTFPRGRPPATVSKFRSEREAGLCRTVITPRTAVYVEWQPSERVARVTRVQVTTAMKIELT